MTKDDPLTVLDFPLLGIDVGTPYDLQRPRTTVDAVNVRGFEPATMRARGGSRPGLVKYLGQIGGDHPLSSAVQHLDFIVDPQGDALTAPDDTESPGITYIADPSSNNFVSRNPPGRRIRRGGNGFQVNRNRPTGTGTKKTPYIVWPTHGPVVQPYILPAQFLDAVAKDPVTDAIVAGTYAYLPVQGTSLTSSAPITVTFTPTNTTVYNSATKTQTIETQDQYTHLTGGTATCTVDSGATNNFTNVMLSIDHGPLAPYPDLSNLSPPGDGNQVGNTVSIIVDGSGNLSWIGQGGS